MVKVFWYVTHLWIGSAEWPLTQALAGRLSGFDVLLSLQVDFS